MLTGAALNARLGAITSLAAMSEEQLNAFAEAIQADTDLQQRLQGISDPDAVVQIAKDRGFIISSDELKMSKELSDEQLAGVTGGQGQCGSCWAFSAHNLFAEEIPER